MTILRFAVLFGLVFVCCVSASFASDRVALVIGNGAYQNASPLENPVNDANDIAEALRELGFDVIVETNVDRNGFAGAIGEFSKKLRGAKLALFYYAGHAMQVNGRNYMLPIDARIENFTNVRYQTIDLQSIIDDMEVEAKASLFILDACRDNPMNLRSILRINPGLAQVQTGGNSLIAFATSPGDGAEDGTGRRNSPFTWALLKHIRTKDIEIRSMLSNVRKDVLELTERRQRPWDTSSLVEPIILAATPPQPETPQPSMTPERSATPGSSAAPPPPPPPFKGRRMALVIGAGNYEKLPKLATTRRDAYAVHSALADLGFNVQSFEDLNKAEMLEAIEKFSDQLEKDDVAFVFFGGHGAHMDGKNYLFPVDVSEPSGVGLLGVRDQGLDADQVVSIVQESEPQGSIFVFDVSRASANRISTRGLEKAQSTSSAFTLFSTNVGQARIDRLGDGDQHPNSPFIRVLVEELRKPDATIFKVANATSQRVSGLVRRVGRQQAPFFSNTADGVGSFVLRQ